MSCKDCQKMRMDYLNAVIALDVARVAKLTGQAVVHMVTGKAPEVEEESRPVPGPSAKTKRK